MRKVISSVLLTLFLIGNINAKSANNNEKEYTLKKAKSCFEFYHELFHEYYGGINLDNVGDFNQLVAQCQALFE